MSDTRSKMEPKDMTLKSKTKVWIGDLSYVLSEAMWEQIISKLPKKDVYEDIVTVKNEAGETFEVAIFSTYSGNGTYEDEDGVEYSVKSGTLGVIPIEAIDPSVGETELGFGLVEGARRDVCITYYGADGTISIETDRETIDIYTNKDRIDIMEPIEMKKIGDLWKK